MIYTLKAGSIRALEIQRLIRGNPAVEDDFHVDPKTGKTIENIAIHKDYCQHRLGKNCRCKPTEFYIVEEADEVQNSASTHLDG